MILERIAGRISSFSDLDRRGMEAIDTQVLGVVSFIDFLLNPTRYGSYLFTLANVIPVTDNVNLLMRTSTDGGSTFDAGASDYVQNTAQRGHGEVADTWTTAGSSATSFVLNPTIGIGSAANEDGLSGVALLLGPDLALDTAAFWLTVWRDSGNNVSMGLGSGIRASSADVDAVRFLTSSGNLESGTISVYGLRKN